MAIFGVKNVEADLFEFRHLSYDFCETDIQVWVEYANETQCYVCARRLDTLGGWADDVRILVVDSLDEAGPRVVHIGPSSSNEMRALIDFSRPLIQGEPVILEPNYHCISKWPGEPRAISREEFNHKFSTNIVVLPTSLFAVSFVVEEDALYIYGEDFARLPDILPTLRHVVRVTRSSSDFTISYNHLCIPGEILPISIISGAVPRAFCSIICATDGYMEGQYESPNRRRPHIVGETECANMYLYGRESADEYAVFGNVPILAQSVHLDVPHTVPVVDRHFFYHNLYNAFRSFHRGIPFGIKIPKIVYGGQDRGSRFNFKDRRDIDVSPRKYFASERVPKTNVVCGGWIDRTEQINYKYVLDIDGHASTWDATAWKLNSGSVIFRVASCWRQWFHKIPHRGYLPNIHYVPIRDDFGDLDEKFAWCEAHPRECEKMIEACKKLFRDTYRMSAVMASTRYALESISRCVSRDKEYN